jgi:hypothetical protein
MYMWCMKETGAATIAHQTTLFDSKMVLAVHHSQSDPAGAPHHQLCTEIHHGRALAWSSLVAHVSAHILRVTWP